MAYLANIPQPSDQIASSQPEILGNFGYIQTTERIDHAWAGSGIAGSIDGTHQKLSMPNQALDITSLGATGCALIQYAIGGNLFTWNGVKNPLSGFSSTADPTLTGTYASIITVPADCIGVIMFVPTLSGTVQFFPFYSKGGTLFLTANALSPPAGTVLVQVSAALTLQAKFAPLTPDGVCNWKTIYWPI